MLGVTKLLCETEETAERLDPIRGGRHDISLSNPRLLQFVPEKHPVIVWNITKRCNLRCDHCYSNSLDRSYPNELTTEEALSVIDDLADFKVPVIIFSGGEPLMREDIFDLALYARKKGIRPTLSSNGVLIDKEIANRIKETGFAYVGVSLDGIGDINDRMRGVTGAYQRSLTGLRNLRDEGVSTGLRLTLSQRTLSELPAIFDLAEVEEIPRIYISHLVYSGRGKGISTEDLSHGKTRKAIDFIFQRAIDFHKRGIKKDILTGNNDADGVYLYLTVSGEYPAKGEAIYRLLKMRGGNSSGVAVGCIDNLGEVHADQFWNHYSFGNVRKRPFSEIWRDTDDSVMRGLKDKMSRVKGRCKACKYLEICGGNYRVRAEFVYRDMWAEDPACYLTDEEIGVSGLKSGAKGGREFDRPFSNEQARRKRDGQRVQNSNHDIFPLYLF